MTRAEIIEFLERKGWVRIGQGVHLYKEVKEVEYRMKIGKLSLRYERRVRHEGKGFGWMRLRSGYYKDLHISRVDKLSGMKR